MRTASSTISPTCPQNTRHHRLHHIPAPGRHATAASGTARRCRGTPAAAECGRSPAGPSALSARCARSASRRRPSGAGAPCEHRRLRLVPPSGSQLGHYRHGAAHVQRAGVGSPLEPRKGWCRGSACAPPAAVRMRRRCLLTCSGRVGYPFDQTTVIWPSFLFDHRAIWLRLHLPPIRHAFDRHAIWLRRPSRPSRGETGADEICQRGTDVRFKQSRSKTSRCPPRLRWAIGRRRLAKAAASSGTLATPLGPTACDRHRNQRLRRPRAAVRRWVCLTTFRWQNILLAPI